MGNFVDGQVFPYVSLRCSPYEGPFSGVEFDQQVAMAVGRSVGGAIGDRFVQAGGD